MENSFSHILPIFLIALLGGILKRKLLNIDEFWQGLERMSYFILTPVILFNNIAMSEAKVGSMVQLIFILILSSIIIGLVLIYYNKHIQGNPKKFTSVFQGNFRFNNYLFLGLAQGLYGSQGLEIAAIVSAYMIIFTNFSTVLIYNIYTGKSKSRGIYNLILISKKVFSNPVIISSIIGFIFNSLDLQLNLGIKLTLDKLTNMGIVVGIIITGAGLKLAFHKDNLTYILQSNITKLILMPIITIILCKVFTLNNDLKYVAVLYACMPTAGSSYIIARQLGGDPESMKFITTSMIILSLLSLIIFTYIIT